MTRSIIVASQPFTFTDGQPLSSQDSANWTEQNGVDGQIIISNGGLAFRGEYGNWTDCCWKGSGSFTADQYFEIKVVGTWTGADTDLIGGSLRNNGGSWNGTTGTDSMYRVFWQPSTSKVQVTKVLLHIPTQVGTDITSVTLAANDLLSAEAVTNGSNVDIIVYKNGVSLGTRTDTAAVLTSGKPGVTGKNHDNAIFGDNFVAGNITASSAADSSGLLLRGIG